MNTGANNRSKYGTIVIIENKFGECSSSGSTWKASWWGDFGVLSEMKFSWSVSPDANNIKIRNGFPAKFKFKALPKKHGLRNEVENVATKFFVITSESSEVVLLSTMHLDKRPFKDF